MMKARDPKEGVDVRYCLFFIIKIKYETNYL